MSFLRSEQTYRERENKKLLNSWNSLERATDCFVPCMKACKRSGISMGSPMMPSTVSLNLAGWAVSQKKPTSPFCRFSFKAR